MRRSLVSAGPRQLRPTNQQRHTLLALLQCASPLLMANRQRDGRTSAAPPLTRVTASRRSPLPAAGQPAVPAQTPAPGPHGPPDRVRQTAHGPLPARAGTRKQPPAPRPSSTGQMDPAPARSPATEHTPTAAARARTAARLARPTEHRQAHGPQSPPLPSGATAMATATAQRLQARPDPTHAAAAFPAPVAIPGKTLGPKRGHRATAAASLPWRRAQRQGTPSVTALPPGPSRRRRSADDRG